VAGIFPVAAHNYSLASKGFPELVLKAALCHLLAGDSQKALSLLDSHPDNEEKILLRAWIAYESKDPKRAVSLLLPLARQGGSDALIRKALYILWTIGKALGEGEGGEALEVLPKEYSPQAVKALLVSRYPGSVESALVEGLAIPRPSVFLFAGFGQEVNSMPSQQAPENSSLSLPLASLPEGDPPAFSRLQVGLFSRRENAVALSAKLLEHGFSASTEERPVQGENAPRWAVIVVTAKDWAATVAQLKDLGYETYLLP
jgi:cell division septation protein DedD